MKKIKIILACANGMSTSILCKKIIDEGSIAGFEVDCKAYGVNGLTESITKGCNVILLGPQVSFMEKDIIKRFNDIPVRVIPMIDYGMMNAKQIFNNLQKELKW